MLCMLCPTAPFFMQRVTSVEQMCTLFAQMETAVLPFSMYTRLREKSLPIAGCLCDHCTDLQVQSCPRSRTWANKAQTPSALIRSALLWALWHPDTPAQRISNSLQKDREGDQYLLLFCEDIYKCNKFQNTDFQIWHLSLIHPVTVSNV